MRVLGALIAALITTTPTVPPADVRGDVGDVRLVHVDGQLANSGNGTDRLFLVLPDGAACPGDSAHDQWRANTFLLPEQENVLDAWFGSTGPEPPWEGSRFPMFDTTTGLALAQLMLQANDSAGQPGIVNQTAETSFRVQAENGITSGRYRIGIACSYFRQTTQYWDLVVQIDAPADGSPESLHWRVVEAPGAAVPQAPEGSAWIGRWLMVGGAVIVLALLVGRRRATADRHQRPSGNSTPPTPSTMKEAHS